MKKCFNCGTEFEGNFCPKCGEKVLRIMPSKSDGLKYAPLTLFALWAVLLWVFFAVKMIAVDLTVEQLYFNLYQALKEDVFVDLFPTLRALLSFAVISNLYVIALSVIYLKDSVKARLFAIGGGVILQLVVCFCAIIDGIEVVLLLGLENGGFMTTVVSYTFLFIEGEIACTILYCLLFDRQKGRKYVAICKNCGYVQDEILTIYENAETINLRFVSQFGFIKSIVVEGGQKFNAENDCLLDLEAKTLVRGCQNSVIPDDGSVKAIGEFAFYKCKRLKEIVIPETVNYIGWGAFRQCKDLNEIKYTGSMAQWKQIFKEPYWYCTSIKRVICNDGTIVL